MPTAIPKKQVKDTAIKLWKNDFPNTPIQTNSTEFELYMVKAEQFEHVDHVKPLNKGGSNWASNLRPSCQPCNTGKSDTWPYPVQSRKFVKNKLP